VKVYICRDHCLLGKLVQFLNSWHLSSASLYADSAFSKTNQYSTWLGLLSIGVFSVC